MALPTPAGSSQGGFLSSSVTAHGPLPPRLPPCLCRKRDPHPVCPLLLSMLPRGRPSEWPPKTFTALSAHSSVEWDPPNPSGVAPQCGVRPPTHVEWGPPTPVWREALLSLGRQGLASFPAPSPGQASLNDGSKASRASLSQEWYVKLGLVKKNGRESAEKSTIKSYFIITPHARFRGGPTLPHLTLKVLTDHLSFLQLFNKHLLVGVF